jgi:hypothetical protein
VVIAGLPWAMAAPFFFQVAATLLGAALIVEGLGRIVDEVWRDADRRPTARFELPQELAETGASLGSLHAIFRTGNRCGDSLCLLLLAVACAAFEIGVVEWLRDEPHAKLFIVALFTPFLAVYLLYRAGRNLWERADVLIFQHGLAYVRGGRSVVYAWEKIESVQHEEIGDAIDEEAVHIRLKYGQPPLRFTCNHFQNLAHLQARLERAFWAWSAAAHPDVDLS